MMNDYLVLLSKKHRPAEAIERTVASYGGTTEEVIEEVRKSLMHILAPPQVSAYTDEQVEALEELLEARAVHPLDDDHQLC